MRDPEIDHRGRTSDDERSQGDRPGARPLDGSAGPDHELDPRLQAGLEHAQRAAHEAIAATRALLDVAEDLVDSPGGVVKLFDALGQLGDLAGRVARNAVDGAPTGRTGSGPEQDPPVQRIPVS